MLQKGYISHSFATICLMKKIIILLSGEGTNAQNIVEKLHMKECEVLCAITNNPDAKGIQRMQDLGIRCHLVDHREFSSRERFDIALVELIHSYRPDLVVLSGFMRILSKEFTEHVKAINLHPSLLPKYKGAKAIEQSFQSGDKECGVSVHWVNSELDGGAVILQKSFLRDRDMNFEEFLASIKKLEYAIVPEAIQKVLKA